MAIINTDPKADTAYVIFTIIFIVFGLAFTRSPFSKNYTTMWVLLSSRQPPHHLDKVIDLITKILLFVTLNINLMKS